MTGTSLLMIAHAKPGSKSSGLDDGGAPADNGRSGASKPRIRLRLLQALILVRQVTRATLLLAATLGARGEVTEESVQRHLQARLPPNVATIRVDPQGPGKVVLYGSVPSLRQRQMAQEAAERTPGVNEVENRLEVDVPPRPDDQIAGDVRAALAADAATELLHLGISATNGIVALAGTVEFPAQRRLALWIASGVRGVRGVQDALQVRPTRRSDQEIQAHLQRYFEESAVFDGDIDVRVRNGQVSLSGEVRSRLQRTWAERDAWVPGVASVDTSAVLVRPAGQDAVGRSRRPPSDESIRRAVLDAMVYDTRVHSVRPEVAVREGIVTLSGSVTNLKAKRAAEQLARHTTGVKDVCNELKVEPADPPSDQELQLVIAAQFDRSAALEDHAIRLEASDGRVTLKGTVPSNAARWEAEDLAARTTGVVEVANELRVRSPAAPAEDFHYYPTATAHEPWFATRSHSFAGHDEGLRQAVLKELKSDALLDASAIEVTSLHGEVTLRGTVSSWLERNLAADKAYAAGAREVHNDLTLAPH